VLKTHWILKFSLAIHFTLVGFWAHSAESKGNAQAQVKLAQSILSKYWEAESVLMRVEKKVILSLLGRESTSSGMLLFSQGQLRMDFNKPIEQVVVINKKDIWLAKLTTQAKKESWKVTRVARSRAENQHALMALLFGDKKVWEKLDVQGVSEKGDLVSIQLKPKKPEFLPGIVRLALIVDKAVNEIRLIRQWDDSESEVQMKFFNMIFDIPFEKNIFDYKPPKGSQITEL